MMKVYPRFRNIDRVFIITGYTVDMLHKVKYWIMPKAGVKHIVHLGACGPDDTTIGIGRGISLWNVI
jgi:hypothetical protein